PWHSCGSLLESCLPIFRVFGNTSMLTPMRCPTPAAWPSRAAFRTTKRGSGGQENPSQPTSEECEERRSDYESANWTLLSYGGFSPCDRRPWCAPLCVVVALGSHPGRGFRP